MTTPNRTALIAKTYKVLKKYYKPVAPVDGRSVLENLLFAICLEDAPYEVAQGGFDKIQKAAYDWNEVRVTTVAEIAEYLAGAPDAKQSAANLKRVLQSIFESQYSFDLEYLRKQNIGKAVKALSKYEGTTPFAVSYVTQHGLGGHAIPLDRGALEVMHIAGIIDDKEKEKQQVPGLERAISKAKGIEFASLLHQLASEFSGAPFSPRVKSILLEINPAAKDRLPKRKPRTAPKSPQPSAKPKTSRAIDSSAKQEVPPTASRQSPPKAKKGKTTKKDPTRNVDAPKKHSTSTRLAKRKPR
jgi:endonuclease-3